MYIFIYMNMNMNINMKGVFYFKVYIEIRYVNAKLSLYVNDNTWWRISGALINNITW